MDFRSVISVGHQLRGHLLVISYTAIKVGSLFEATRVLARAAPLY